MASFAMTQIIVHYLENDVIIIHPKNIAQEA